VESRTTMRASSSLSQRKVGLRSLNFPVKPVGTRTFSGLAPHHLGDDVVDVGAGQDREGVAIAGLERHPPELEHERHEVDGVRRDLHLVPGGGLAPLHHHRLALGAIVLGGVVVLAPALVGVEDESAGQPGLGVDVADEPLTEIVEGSGQAGGVRLELDGHDRALPLPP